jgi:hypothetical protein
MLHSPAPPPVAHAIARGETSGELSAPPQLPGSLGIPVQGCQLSTGGADALVIRYRPRSLRIDGRAHTAQRIVAAVRFPTTESHQLGHELQFSLQAAGHRYSWTSVTGTLRWADGLRNGSFTAALKPSGGAANHRMQLRGTWRRCFTAPTL